MPARIYTDKDADLKFLRENSRRDRLRRTRSRHALNLRDSGLRNRDFITKANPTRRA
jgi:hypothetical protein